MVLTCQNAIKIIFHKLSIKYDIESAYLSLGVTARVLQVALTILLYWAENYIGTLFNLKLMNINIERRKRTFALTMVLQLRVSQVCECKTIVNATCDTLAVIITARVLLIAMTKYGKMHLLRYKWGRLLLIIQ